MSSLTTLARPYARAAFEVARESGALAEWAAGLEAAAVAVSEPTMAAYLGSPQEEPGATVDMVLEALGRPGSEPFERFLVAMAEHERLPLLPRVVELFGELRQEAEQRLEVRVVSAAPLVGDQAERMKAALTRRFERDVSLDASVDPSLIGGAVIYAGDEVIDGSVLGRLRRLAGSLA
ncbi:MAG: F0F1 ATP synthase subunit delta [Xanthomonadales bacterium]|jgi:F-type H+-transporting ATPase subunit delta|nr:F0F1 ATP synthase subunit delta [Xanthomonadales bacterium]